MIMAHYTFKESINHMGNGMRLLLPKKEGKCMMIGEKEYPQPVEDYEVLPEIARELHFSDIICQIPKDRTNGKVGWSESPSLLPYGDNYTIYCLVF